MTDKDMEKYLASAVEQNTPDILDALLDELEFADPQESLGARLLADEEQSAAAKGNPAAGGGKDSAEDRFVVVQPSRKYSGRSGSLLKPLMSIAAALVLVVGGLAVFRNASSTFAVVGMDVNPGIELTINRNEKVTGARAVNSEGEEILSEMDLRGTDINTACNAVAGAMLTHGYLTDTSNSILMSVQAKDPALGKDVEKRVSENLNAYLEDSMITHAIMAQYVDDDDELKSFAEANGISVGKALLIRKLLNTGSTKMTEQDLLALSTQDLILLGQSRNAGSDISFGSADTSKYIGEDAAVTAALAEAGIHADAAAGLKTEFDCDDGKIVYEVEFTSGGMEYEYEIDAVSGAVTSSEVETADADDDNDAVDDSDDDDSDDDDSDDDPDDEDDD